jgi:hypothetical protein
MFVGGENLPYGAPSYNYTHLSCAIIYSPNGTCLPFSHLWIKMRKEEGEALSSLDFLLPPHIPNSLRGTPKYPHISLSIKSFSHISMRVSLFPPIYLLPLAFLSYIPIHRTSLPYRRSFAT